jgi:hypothetical protein
MKSQDKYDECLALLSEIHDISHMLIEAGMDGEMSSIELLEEALRVIKSIDSGVSMEVVKSSNKKEKKVLH